MFQSNIRKLVVHLRSGMVYKLSWCWQTRATRLRDQSRRCHGTWYHSIC